MCQRLAPPNWLMPPQWEILDPPLQFYHFCIHFQQKRPTFEVHAPTNGPMPPLWEILDPPLQLMGYHWLNGPLVWLAIQHTTEQVRPWMYLCEKCFCFNGFVCTCETSKLEFLKTSIRKGFLSLKKIILFYKIFVSLKSDFNSITNFKTQVLQILNCKMIEIPNSWFLVQ